MFIFIFQTIWLFIDDLAGKGLDIVIIGKFLFYLMPNLTEKVLPLTVLLSSILTFGAFAENYEFAAMKASGISLQRSMLSLIVFVVFLGGVTFYFANSVIPASEQKIFNMRRNIAKVKPAAVIEEGVFSDFEGLNIKVDEKFGENDRFLNNVVIHKKSDLQLNNPVIKARTGELISSEASEIIQLVLKDGHYYEDLRPSAADDQRKYPFAKSNFDTYTINILVPQDEQDLEEDRDIRTDKMKNIARLKKDIDSLEENNVQVVAAFSKNIVNRMGAFPIDQPRDSALSERVQSFEKTEKIDSVLRKKKEIRRDSVHANFTNVVALYQEWQQIQMLGNAKNTVSNILNSIQGKKEDLQRRYKIHNMHILSLHNKFALAFSCIILFFVGAPLGAIIRKGGLGLPMVIAIVLFLAYYFIGVFAGNYAKEGNIHPIMGAWLSTLIMLPLGIFLTRSFGHIVDTIRELFKKQDEEPET